TDGVKSVLVIAGDAVVLVAVVVDPGIELARVGRPRPLLVGFGTGIARQAGSDGQDGEAGDGGLDAAVHGIPCELLLPPCRSGVADFVAGKGKACARLAQGPVIDQADPHRSRAGAQGALQREILLYPAKQPRSTA